MTGLTIIQERIALLRSTNSALYKNDIRRLARLHDALKNITDLDYDAVTELASDMPENLRILSSNITRKLSDVVTNSIPQLVQKLFNLVLPGTTEESQVLRAMNKNFWRRALLILVLQQQEYQRLSNRQVGEHQQYASAAIIAHRENQLKQQKEWLKNSQLFTTIAGKPVILPLDKIVKTATQRIARVYAFVAAIDKIATENDLETALITTTLSGEWHSNPRYKSKIWQWNGASPKDCADELTRIFQNIRRDLDNAGVYLSGVWCGELHKDGTPHRHYLASYKREHAALIRSVFLKYLSGRLKLRGSTVNEDIAFMTSEDALNNKFIRLSDSPKLSKKGFQTDISIIDRARGSGASYVFKYLEKALLREAVFETSDAFKAIDASRALWRMRSFDFFGIQKCLGRWDELRKLDKAPLDSLLHEHWTAARGGDAEGKIDYVLDEKTQAYVPAQRGDAYKFLLLNGSLAALRSSRVSTAKLGDVREEITLSKKQKINQYYEDVLATNGVQHVIKERTLTRIKVDAHGEILTYKCGARKNQPRFFAEWSTTVVAREITRPFDWTIEKKGAEKKRELIVSEYKNYLERMLFKKNFVGPVLPKILSKTVFKFSQILFEF